MRIYAIILLFFYAHVHVCAWLHDVMMKSYDVTGRKQLSSSIERHACYWLGLQISCNYL